MDNFAYGHNFTVRDYIEFRTRLILLTQIDVHKNSYIRIIVLLAILLVIYFPCTRESFN